VTKRSLSTQRTWGQSYHLTLASKHQRLAIPWNALEFCPDFPSK